MCYFILYIMRDARGIPFRSYASISDRKLVNPASMNGCYPQTHFLDKYHNILLLSGRLREWLTVNFSLLRRAPLSKLPVVGTHIIMIRISGNCRLLLMTPSFSHQLLVFWGIFV